MSSTRTPSLRRLVATGASVAALLALGACGLDSDPPAQDISDVQPDTPTPTPTPTGGSGDGPLAHHRHGGSSSADECPPPPEEKYVAGPWINPSEGCPQWWED